LTQTTTTSMHDQELPVDLLAESFGWIRDRRRFAELFYQTGPFAREAPIRALFATLPTAMPTQEETLMELIASAIGLLRKGDMATLQTAAGHLGRKLQEYGVWPGWFESAGASLMETFPLYLAEKGSATSFTEAHQKAWEQGYRAIAALLLQGYVDASALRVPVPLTFDLSGMLGVSGSDQRIAARCFPPRITSPYLPQVWAFLMHGGSYSWRYWHLQVEGDEPDTYSFAAYLAEHGIGVIAIDHPGCGMSRWDCHGEELTLETVARADYLAVLQARERLASGSLIPGLAPVSEARIVGVGHSMGGGIGTVMAGQYPDCFDAWAALGWTNQPLQLAGIEEQATASSLRHIENGYVLAQTETRALMRTLFYLEDVPARVIEADERWATTVPVGVLTLMLPGTAAQYARRIRVPVLILYGAPRDVVADPATEPGQYPNAASTTLLIQQGSAHCHNFSRQHLTVKALVLRWLWQVADTREASEQVERSAAAV
jgi:pimeloyl-ACP methyl ester carboxylesterase